MFRSDHLVYLHLPKTGGTFVTRVLEDVVGGHQVLGHPRLPEDVRRSGVPVLGSIRNPWDWYVSLWAFGCRGRGSLHPRVTARSPRGHGFLEHFPTALRCLWNEVSKPVGRWRWCYEDVRDPARFRAWLAMVLAPERRHDVDPLFARSSLGGFAGFLSFRYLYLYLDDVRPLLSGELERPDQLEELARESSVVKRMLRMEHLSEDLWQALVELDVPVREGAEERVRGASKIHESPDRLGLEPYYDLASAELVAARDGWLAARYGYPAPIQRDA